MITPFPPSLPPFLSQTLPSQVQGVELRAGSLSRPTTGLFSALYSTCHAVLCSDPVLLFYEDSKRQRLKDLWTFGRPTVCTVSGRSLLLQPCASTSHSERSLKVRCTNASDASAWQLAIQSAIDAAFGPAETAPAEAPTPHLLPPSSHADGEQQDGARARETSFQVSGALMGGVELGGSLELPPAAASPAHAPPPAGTAGEVLDVSSPRSSGASSLGGLSGSSDEGSPAALPAPIERALVAAREAARDAAAASQTADGSGGNERDAWSAAEWSRSLELGSMSTRPS
jgi:hypothetical protein